jgi:hypothetical protein
VPAGSCLRTSPRQSCAEILDHPDRQTARRRAPRQGDAVTSDQARAVVYFVQEPASHVDEQAVAAVAA